MTSIEWSLPAVHDAVAAAVPDRDMIVWKATRRTYGEVVTRSQGLASFLVARGLGAHAERSELERWECGQDRVALVLRNCPEYLESMLGCYRARSVPFNVNHHYQPGEVGALFDMLDPAAVIYHRSLGPLLDPALEHRRALLLDVDDDSGVPPRSGSIAYEAAVSGAGAGAVSLPVASPDDLYLVCTGGTTGTPKGVLWRQADIYIAGMGGAEQTTEASLTDTARAGAGAWFAAPPLMHAAAQWTAFGGVNSGATIVLHDDAQPFDARTILETAAREQVSLVSIVGDAYTRPIVEELQRARYDLSSLRVIATGGAATNERFKDALLELLPNVVVIDGYGASETGAMAFGASSRGQSAKGFAPAAGAAVVAADKNRFLQPGEDEIGWTARRGRIPLGYLDDQGATEATFPIIEGERVSVPGDRARLSTDGAIDMLGRDSMVVNTGGEKVFVEEVEEVLRRHEDVVDALVVGRPSERFGEEVVAVVQLREGATIRPLDLREYAAASLARFKAPRAVAVCDCVPRLANGKADYARARSIASDAAVATSEG